MANPGHASRSLSTDTSATSRWRRNRSIASPPDQVVQPPTDSLDSRGGTTQGRLGRTASKMSLFNLFSKPKVEKARGHIEVGLAVPMPPPEEQKHIGAASVSKTSHLNPPATPHRSRSSQMLRPMSMRPASFVQKGDNWDPPPLFQAFPQSVKHATLQSCVLSPDVLLRTHSQKKQFDLLRERMDSHRDLSSMLDNVPEMKKLEKTHSHKRLTSIAMNSAAPQLTDKVFILVTSGYVLQYAGEGSFDRLPEKVLKLGKDSAAFACDAIPGRHWVLQISQSASQDGTVAVTPKTSLLSRLRSQNSAVNRPAGSFLLVLESAEDMNEWMTAVRKEIDKLGGMKAKDEAVRQSSSSDDTSRKRSEDVAPLSHRYLVKRDPNRMSKLPPVDSPHQSQYSESPKAISSEPEEGQSERNTSVSDAASTHSSKPNKRKSVEIASIATTTVSHDQFQLDQLRDTSRHSHVSSATSISGPATRNNSRASSPTPTSPLSEGFSPVDAEPLRSATSLKSFHMIPGNSTTNRRRSMQPLPVTNEDSTLSVDAVPATAQRHSVYVPLSPTASSYPVPPHTSADAVPPLPTDIPEDTPTSQLAPLLCRPTRDDRDTARPGGRSSSAPPVRHGTISPPPPNAATNADRRPMSTFGAGTLSPPSINRRAPSPKLFLRPFPVRPQAQHADGSGLVVPRRMSSLGPPPTAAVGPPMRSVTAPVRAPLASSASRAAQNDATKPPALSQPLRRPTSVQIRSDPAPFLSSSRPVGAPIRAISSTPSFIPGNRAPSAPRIQVQHATSVPALREHAQQSGTPLRQPILGIPPPAPPPDMPLPLPPPPPTIALPAIPQGLSRPHLPPNLPLPAPPPSGPLPLPPPDIPLPVSPAPRAMAC